MGMRSTVSANRSTNDAPPQFPLIFVNLLMRRLIVHSCLLNERSNNSVVGGDYQLVRANCLGKKYTSPIDAYGCAKCRTIHNGAGSLYSVHLEGTESLCRLMNNLPAFLCVTTTHLCHISHPSRSLTVPRNSLRS